LKTHPGAHVAALAQRAMQQHIDEDADGDIVVDDEDSSAVPRYAHAHVSRLQRKQTHTRGQVSLPVYLRKRLSILLNQSTVSSSSSSSSSSSVGLAAQASVAAEPTLCLLPSSDQLSAIQVTGEVDDTKTQARRSSAARRDMVVPITDSARRNELSRVFSSTGHLLGDARILAPLFHIFGRTLEYHGKQALPTLLSRKHAALLVWISPTVADKVSVSVQLIVRPDGYQSPTVGLPVGCHGQWVPHTQAKTSQWAVLGPKVDLPNKPASVVFAREFLGLDTQLLCRNMTLEHESVQLPLPAALYTRDPTQEAGHARCFLVSSYVRHGNRTFTAAQVGVNARPTDIGFTIDVPVTVTPSSPAVPTLALPILCPYLVAPCALDTARITSMARESCCASLSVLVVSRDCEYANWAWIHTRPPVRTVEADQLNRTSSTLLFCVWQMNVMCVRMCE
jgi:hypothetical protein